MREFRCFRESEKIPFVKASGMASCPSLRLTSMAECPRSGPLLMPLTNCGPALSSRSQWNVSLRMLPAARPPHVG